MSKRTESDSSLGGPTIFIALFTVNVLFASLAPIQDCDEVFNFWEPTHYLNHGYGMQTWELSPDYAIRSWLYTSIHAALIHVTTWLPYVDGKASGFAILRVIFAGTCAACETALHGALARTVNRRVATIFVLICASSAGMFHASIAYLPSTAAMYCSMQAVACLLTPRSRRNFAAGMTWFAAGTILGWPFVAVLAAPFVFEELYASLAGGDLSGCIRRIADGLIRSVSILAIEMVFDSAFYGKLVCVPFNIVKYNIFSAGKGPNIYGVDPWHFYIRNLLINFNLWFLLACITLPLLALSYITGSSRGLPQNKLNLFIFTSLFYVWLGIFTIQPHKEERFMYPIYPFIAGNAALSLHMIIVILSPTSAKPSDSSSSHLILKSLKRATVISILGISTALGLLRITGLVTGYSAPLELYGGMQTGLAAHSVGDTTNRPLKVCVGKEWYRFPSSYLLPNNARLKFVKGEFSGLMPGEFYESTNWRRELFPGARMTPPGMNDENKEHVGKYTPLTDCDYLVDSSFASQPPSALEPDHLHDDLRWRKIVCLPFLDTAATGVIGRLFWLPESDLLPTNLRRKWGSYCLLEAKRATVIGKSPASDRSARMVREAGSY